MGSKCWFGMWAAVAGVGLVLSTGCEDRDFSAPSSAPAGTPAAGLDVNGFWEGELEDRTTCAAPFEQSGASVASRCKIGEMGDLVGTINGYHMEFTFTHDDGWKETGSGDFDEAGLSFEADLGSVGHFIMLWRGPDYQHHDPYGEPLTYSK
ncbi:MAG: hypothetical protein C0404_12760 [Verrucomicrobia bacterium]|nr:hypothetical protein [Verrucomicrobiota bacterium]